MLRKFGLLGLVSLAALMVVACGGSPDPAQPAPSGKDNSSQVDGGQQSVDSGANDQVPGSENQTGQNSAPNSQIDITSETPGQGTGQSASTPQGISPGQGAGKEEVQMVDVQIGQPYSPGTRVNFPDLGVSFAIPNEWVGQIPPEAEAFVLGSNTRAGLIIAVSHQATQTDELVANLQQPIPLDQGVVLNLQEQPEVNGSQVNALVAVSDGINNFSGYLTAVVRNSGPGVIFVGFGPEPVEYYQGLVGELASTLLDTEVKTAGSSTNAGSSGPSTSSTEVQEWDVFLRGKKLTYMSSYSSNSSGGGGFSSQREYYLCRDGLFQYGDSSSISGGDFGSFTGGNPSSSGQGTWEIISEGSAIGIRFNWSDGTTGMSRLEFYDNKTYLDGDRYFVTDDNPYC